MSPKESVIPVFVPHYGCPHQCVFCNQRHIAGTKTPCKPEDVIRILKAAAAIPSNGKRRQLAFYGGSFTAIPAKMQEELLGAAQRFIDDGTIFSIRVSTRPDTINPEVIERLIRFNVSTVEIGAQSMDEKVLRAAGRGHSRQDVINASKMIKDSGLHLVLQMMTGLPEAGEDSDIITATQLADLKPDAVRIYPTVVVKDTELYDMWAKGEYKEHTVEAATVLCAKIVPIFDKAGINIIRLGLNPSEELSGDLAVCGAYHPAFGELVRSRIFLDEAKALLKGIKEGSDVILSVSPAYVSQLIGQGKANIKILREEYGLKSLRVKQDISIKDRQIRVFIAK
ncbi:MAG: radical SAM protein [Ruminococcaceae bacterium]|nr:radical SAM protein [Oscillospiraceae bacterium]